MLDDSRAIEGVVRRRSGSRARGPLALREELLKRGAPEDEVDRHLSLITGEAAEAQMMELLSKKCKISDSRSKAARMLLSRGFDEDEVSGALERFFGSADHES